MQPVSPSSLFDRFVIRLGDERSMVVYRLAGGNNNNEAEGGSLFSQTQGLYAAFGFETNNGFSSYCSKKKIVSIENDGLKTQLRLKGVVRFFNGGAIKKLIEDRLVGKALEFALLDYEKALSGVTANPGLPPLPSLILRRPAEEDDRTMVIRPAPIPFRMDEQGLAVPKLRLPREEHWWDNEDYVIGKKFSLPEYDQSPALKVELQSYRTFWWSKIRRGEMGRSFR